MKTRSATGMITFAIAIALSLTGCLGSAPAKVPEKEGPSPSNSQSNDKDESKGNSNSGNSKPSQVDPTWPWPADVPRPKGIVYEMTSGNPLGDGGVWQADFEVRSFDEAQAFVDELIASGWEGLLGSEAMKDEETAAWSISKGELLGSVTIDDLKANPILVSFSFLGTVG